MRDALIEQAVLAMKGDESTHYAFPVRYDRRWQGGAITDTVAQALIVCGRQQDHATVEAGVRVTLTTDAFAQWAQEWTTPKDHRWPSLWGAVPVAVGRIHAVWVPLARQSPPRCRQPGRGSLPRREVIR